MRKILVKKLMKIDLIGPFFKLYTVREITIHSIFRKPHKITEEFYMIINKSKNFIEKIIQNFTLYICHNFTDTQIILIFNNQKILKKQ